MEHKKILYFTHTTNGENLDNILRTGYMLTPIESYNKKIKIKDHILNEEKILYKKSDKMNKQYINEQFPGIFFSPKYKELLKDKLYISGFKTFGNYII